MGTFDGHVVALAKEYAKTSSRLARLAAERMGWSEQELAGFHRGAETADRLIQEMERKRTR